MNPMFQSHNQCQPMQPQFIQAPMNTFMVPPFKGDVSSSQDSCNTAVTLKVTGIQNTPIDDRTLQVEGAVLIFNDVIDKLQWKTIPQIFLDNPTLIPAISANVTGLQATIQKNVASGYAGLDTNTKILVAQLPIMVGASASSVGISGAVPTALANANPGTRYLADDATWKTIASNQVLTTKGDLLTRDATTLTDVRFPVGLNDQTLVADSTTATGLKWADKNIIEISSVSNLPLVLLPKTLYITTNNGEVFYNLAGVTKQLNKSYGYTKMLIDSLTTGTYTLIATGNDFVSIAPISNYTVTRIATLSTTNVTEGNSVTFSTYKLTAANILSFKYIVAAVDFDGTSSTELVPDTFFEFAYTGTQWIRTK